MPLTEKEIYYGFLIRIILISFGIYEIIQGLAAFIDPNYVVSSFVLKDDSNANASNERQELIKILQYCGGGFVFTGLVSLMICVLSSQSGIRNLFITLLSLFSLCEAVFISVRSFFLFFLFFIFIFIWI
jgi:hypothetical protein